MKSHLRRIAAIVIVVALSLPTVALAASHDDRDRGRGTDPIVRIIKKIQKLLGIGSNDDIPTPPKP